MARLSKKEWIEQSKEDKEVALKMQDYEANEIGKSTAELIKFLDVQARFELYSVGNCLLITRQEPNAILCRDENEWSKRGYPIKSDKNPIIIIEASMPKIKEDGSKVTYFNSKRVYDITETSAPLPPKEDAISNKTLLSGLLKASPVNVNEVDDVGKEDKYALYSEENNCINVCKAQDLNFLIQDFVTEVAKYNFSKIPDSNKEIIPFKATCVCYLFCKKHQIPFPKEAFQNLKCQLKGEAKDIKFELGTIKDVYVKIKDEMNVEIQGLTKQSKAKEQVR